MAGQGLPDRAAGGHVPQPDRVIGAAAGQGLAVRAERHRVDRAGVAGQGLPDRAAGGHVPQPDRVIAAAAGQGLAVRAERHRGDRAGVAGQRAARSGGRWPRPTAGSCRSSLPLARVLPSGLNATESTEPVWPVRMPVPGSAAAVSIA